MESRPLKQIITRVLDTQLMIGTFTKRQVVDRVLRDSMFSMDLLSLRDQRAALSTIIMTEVTAQMKEPLPDEIAAQIQRHLPPGLVHRVEQFPRCICISLGGGSNAQHIALWKASREHWDNNVALRDAIIKHNRTPRDTSRDILYFLVEAGADSLESLWAQRAA